MSFIKKNIRRIKFVAYSAIDFFRFQITKKHTELSSKKKILFVGDHLQARIPRIAKLLNSTSNYETVLITLKGKDYSQYNTEFFHKQITYRTYWDLKRILKKEGNCSLIHSFGPPNWATKIAIKSGNKTIMDCQDMYVTYYGLEPPFMYMKLDLPNEKYCLENAAGVISQSHEPYNAFKTFEIKKRPKTLFFPLYCDEDYTVIPKGKISDSEIHIAYAGGVAANFQTDKHYDSMKIHWVAKTFNEQKLHFHLYPSPTVSNKVLDEYKELAEQLEYFHIHNTISQNKLAEELSQYHYGILPFFNKNNARRIEKRIYSTSLKIFNYMESGVPVIISEDASFQAWMCKRFGGGVTISHEDMFSLGEKLRSIDYQKQYSLLLENRESIMLKKNFPRLIKFYEEVSK